MKERRADSGNANVAAEIRGFIGDYLDAVRAKDLDRLASFYAPDVRAFDAIAKLEFRGRGAYLDHWAECLSYCPGPMVIELEHVEIETAGDLALVHGLSRCGGVDADGKEQVAWMRMTAGYRRVDGRWQVAHEHYSAPFDPQTGAMMGNLTP